MTFSQIGYFKFRDGMNMIKDQNLKQDYESWGETSLGIEFGPHESKLYSWITILNPSVPAVMRWENQLIDGYWTYHMNDVIHGLAKTYHQLKQEIEKNYGVTMQKIGSIGCSAMMQGYHCT